MKEYPYGDRWLLSFPGNRRSCIKFSVEQWINISNHAVKKNGFFSVALSGGSTPLSIYQELTSKENKDKIPWDKTYLFWSDERSVPPTSQESNYRMALEEGGLGHVGIPQENIFRMVAEKDIEKNALLYEETIKSVLKNRPFDLVMLGIGDDGHTASLFPHTEALHANRTVVANQVPQLNTWRMTLTFDCINRAANVEVYVFGKAKAQILESIFLSPYKPDTYPAQRVGTTQNRARFIIDDEASRNILTLMQS